MSKLNGPVCLVTVPFNQLANMAVFAKAHRLQTVFYGSFQGTSEWLVYCQIGEWPHEYPMYLEGTGITIEDFTDDVVLARLLPRTEWEIGL